ncbi:hypothetical protein CC2G_012842 [Coprinopsis cinerea AmutBmut pab1-1]|nr:hypothetical protein CC2G_012842 [Coprinopsis cinerea AmutBmut pab1-1]
MVVEILDIRSSSRDGTVAFDLSQEVLNGLSRPVGEKTLPSMLLWDEEGLRLFDNVITTVPEYYPFATEKKILEEHADEIVNAMPLY